MCPSNPLCWRAIATLLLAALASNGRAQVASQPTAPQPAAETLRLRVVGERAELRSRPDANSLVVAHAQAGMVLESTGKDPYGWYRVQPPPGTFSFVAAEFIDRRSVHEGIVSVRSGTLRVRVGSLVYDVDPEQSETQTRLERGERVHIVGEFGGWLKIAIPPAVSLFVDSGQVVPAPLDIDAQAPPGSTTNPAPASAASRAPESVAPASSAPAVASSAPAPETGPDLTGPWGRRLASIEGEIARESHRPIPEQSWSAIADSLRPIAEQREEPMVAQLAAAWSAQIQARVARQATLQEAAELLRRAARDQSQHEREMERITRAHAQTTQQAFAACGLLRRSFALEQRAGQRGYKLEDPVTQQITAYVVAAPGASPALEENLDQLVGLIGERRTTPTLGADLIEVRTVVPFATDPPASRPARQAPKPAVNSRLGLDTREDVQ